MSPLTQGLNYRSACDSNSSEGWTKTNSRNKRAIVQL